MKLPALIFTAILLTTTTVSAAQKWNWRQPSLPASSNQTDTSAQTAASAQNTENQQINEQELLQQLQNISSDTEETMQDDFNFNLTDNTDNFNMLNEDDFSKADINHDGVIEEDELLQFQQNNFSTLVNKTFTELDLNRDGQISKEEITSYYSKQSTDSETLNGIAKRFADADIDNNNYLDHEELFHFLQKDMLNNNKMVFQLFDINQDGQITQEEMSQIINTFKGLY